MPSFRQVVVGAVVLGMGLVNAGVALPKMTPQMRRAYDFGVLARANMEARQNPATGLPDGLTDLDILEFALTLEHLETAFYQQGFAKFADADFAALGLLPADITNLKSIVTTESTHVNTLTAALVGAGSEPAQPCIYNFGFTTAAAMVATAGVLENIGVSAYLAAAPLVKTPGILTVAAEIVTVEARHQTFIRTASKVAAIPSAFDTPLGIRAVFTLAAGFITSCPVGSILAITPFPPLTRTASATPLPSVITAGTSLAVSSTATGATSCAFVNGGEVGGAAFVPYTNGACVVPPNLSGIAYLHLTNASPATGILTDAITVAGPLVITIT